MKETTQDNWTSEDVAASKIAAERRLWFTDSQGRVWSWDGKQWTAVENKEGNA